MRGATAGELATAFLDAVRRKDIDAAIALLTEDVVWHVDGAPEVPTVGLLQGSARVKAWLEGFGDAFESRGFRTSAVIDHGTEAIVPGWFRYLIRPTRRTVEGDFAMRFTVRDGLISHYQIYEDSLILAQAFEADMVTRPGAHRLPVNGTTYGYDDHGEGPVVLFLHGLFDNRSVSDAQVRPLEDRHRCVSIDLPAHGATGWTLDDAADDISLMIREKGWTPAAVVGHSHGAQVAIALAARHPNLIRRLVLVDAGARPDLRPLLPTIQTPTLVIAGAANAIPPDHAAELANLIPNAHLETLAGTPQRLAHFLEAPPET